MTSIDIKCRIAEEELAKVWPEWHVVKHLGGGAFGDVFHICKESYGVRADSALKIIQAANSFVHNQGTSDDVPVELVNEIRIMEALRGAPNIVAIEDFTFTREEKISSLFVRMELLSSFEKLIQQKERDADDFPILEILKIGLDICKALNYCEKKNILHRDIKPANLFVDSFGDYKVGDFGASRRMETIHPAAAMTSIGTISYMAPEVFAGKQYDASVDTYALGLVLYQLLNHYRPPFAPPLPLACDISSIIQANYRRLNGEEIPSIAGTRMRDGFVVDTSLDELIRKACKGNARDRYRSAEDFHRALSGYASHLSSGYKPFPGHTVSDTRTGKVKAFQELMKFSEQSPVVSRETYRMIQGTKLYTRGFKAVPVDRGRLRAILVRQSLTLEAARDFAEGGMHTAVLNFANPVEPGGGVLRGARGQEQHLCQWTNLYKSLISETGQKFYAINRQLLEGKYLGNQFIGVDALIYSPDVLVMKENRRIESPETGLRIEETYLPKPYHVDVITCPAPFFAGRQYLPSDNTLFQIFTNRIAGIFEAAMDHRVEVLILGAYGCGAFHNPPDVVAKAFHWVITQKRYCRAFKVIVFALAGDPMSENSLAFRKIFEK